MSRATGGRVHGSLIIIVPLSVSQKNYAQPKRRERKRELRLINTNKIHSVRKADELPFRLQKRIEHLSKTRSGIVRCVAAHSSFLRISSVGQGI
jgi:hypothetical protein